MDSYGRSLSHESVCEACHPQKHPYDPMWSIRFVCLQPRDMLIGHFKDEDLREVSLHSLFEDMVGGRLDCRILPILGLKIVHDGVTEGAHTAHRLPKALPDRHFSLHQQARKVEIDNNCVLGK